MNYAKQEINANGNNVILFPILNIKELLIKIHGFLMKEKSKTGSILTIL